MLDRRRPLLLLAATLYLSLLASVAQAQAPASVDLNTATQAQLEELKGIGPANAKKIIDGRPYGKIEDVMKVSGIKEGIFGKIKDSITVQ